jgi:NADH-quinone oxidoreductase subunit H
VNAVTSFLTQNGGFWVLTCIKIALLLVIVMTVNAYLTWFERKVVALMQSRIGPHSVGPHGLLQPAADGLKFLFKVDVLPAGVDKFVYLLAPFLALTLALASLSVIPFGPNPLPFKFFGHQIDLWITNPDIGLLVLFSITALGVYGVALAGWASNSKYPLLGGLRSSAQMVSYELAMTMSVVGVLLMANSFSLTEIIEAQRGRTVWGILPAWNIISFHGGFPQIAGFLCFFIAAIAETNRVPFDLPEAESELVAGFHTEYSGFRWSLFFMAEYAAMVVVTAVATTLYLGGWYFPFVYRLTEAKGFHNAFVAISVIVFLAKAGLLLYLYFWLRWTLPRFRYDQLMDLGWKWMLPAALINIVITALGVGVIQGLDNPAGMRTIKSLEVGLGLTAGGKAIAIAIGIINLFITAGFLSLINWRSRDFNLKKQRRQIRLVDLPKGKPAVMPVASESQT